MNTSDDPRPLLDLLDDPLKLVQEVQAGEGPVLLAGQDGAQVVLQNATGYQHLVDLAERAADLGLDKAVEPAHRDGADSPGDVFDALREKFRRTDA